MNVEILAVLLGQIRPFRGDDEPSAIGKLPVVHPVAVGPMGLAGDEQADRTVHGGIDKAIHHYPADHYDGWRAYLGDVPLLDTPGAFGENISTLGLDESSVFIGDRFRLGTALVEVSQARQPCWKLRPSLRDKGGDGHGGEDAAAQTEGDGDGGLARDALRSCRSTPIPSGRWRRCSRC